MPTPGCVVPVFLMGALVLMATQGVGQQPQDSSAAHFDSAKAAPATPPWRDSVRYGGGPSVGAPPSDYSGAKPPAQWCLRATRRAPGDFGVTGQNWTQASRSWLRQVLSDTTDDGAIWRKVLGGAPQLAPTDSIVQVTDEAECRVIAEILKRDLLGWEVGPPPVVVFRVKDYLIAYPSNAARGEFGMAAGMSLRHQIRGVALW
jgi:hypothetical protein